MKQESFPTDRDQSNPQEGVEEPTGPTLPRNEPVVNTGGGTFISGDVNAHEFIGRDKTIITEETSYNVAGLPNPYLGLSAFTYRERAAFGGREDSIHKAMQKLVTPGEQRSLLFITGASGCGKSSFAQAGLLPALEAHYQERHKQTARAVFWPSKNPFSMLADALTQLSLPELAPQELACLAPEEFSHFLGSHTPKNQVNLIAIDQFEEFFTQSTISEREVLFSFLPALPGFEKIRTHILVTLRSDFLNELFNDQALWEIAKQGIELRVMTVEELKIAIQQPLWAASSQRGYQGKRFEPTLVERLAQDSSPDAAYLPLLQVTLLELWNGGSLTLGRYRGLADAIHRRAETVFHYVDYEASRPERERTPEDQAAILDILLDLVEVSLDDDPRRDVRHRRLKSELIGKSPHRQCLVDDLIQARLLCAGEDIQGEERVETVDIIHESLIRNWDRQRAAIAERRQALQRRSRFVGLLREWLGNGRSDEYVLTGVRLAEAGELAEDDIELRRPEAREFLQRSTELAEAVQRRELEQAQALVKAERRRVRIARFFSLSLGIVLILAIGLAGYALSQSQLSRSRELAAVALNQINIDPERAVLIALEANRTRHTHEAEDALQRSLLTMNLVTTFLGNEERINSAAFSPDGLRGVYAISDETARVWDAETGRELSMLLGHEDWVYNAAFSPDGQRVVTASADKTARVWDAETGRELAVLRGHEFSVRCAVFSYDGQRAVTASADTTARVWDAATGWELAVLRGHEDAVLSAAFSYDGQRVVTAGYDRTARVWDAATGRELAVLRGHEDAVLSAAFSPDGQRVVTASADKTARVWDAETGRELAVLRGHERSVFSTIFSPDGQRVVTASADMTARVWDAATGRELAVLRGHEDWVYNAAFSLDGQRVMTASVDRTVREHFIDIEALVALARELVTRDLTPEEREMYLQDE